jgi:hypothetical protein
MLLLVYALSYQLCTVIIETAADQMSQTNMGLFVVILVCLSNPSRGACVLILMPDDLGTDHKELFLRDGV